MAEVPPYSLAFAVCDAKDLSGLGCAIECAYAALTETGEFTWLKGTSEGRAIEFLIGDLCRRTSELQERLQELDDRENRQNSIEEQTETKGAAAHEDA